MRKLVDPMTQIITWAAAILCVLLAVYAMVSGVHAQSIPVQPCEQQLADVKQYANVLATSRNNTEAMLAQTAAQVTELKAKLEALQKQAAPIEKK